MEKRRGKADTQQIIMSVDIPNHDGNIHFLEALASGRIAGTELPEDEEVRFGKIPSRLPTNENGKVPKYTAAHYHAALARAGCRESTGAADAQQTRHPRRA